MKNLLKHGAREGGVTQTNAEDEEGAMMLGRAVA
jgi:hypothetical protein